MSSPGNYPAQDPSALVADVALAKACLDNDRNAQRMLYARYSRDMYTLCLRYARDEDDAQDILQDGFVKVFNKMSLYNGQGSLKGWIVSTMVRTAIDHYRKRKREREVMSFDIETDEPVVAEVESDLASEHILLLVQALPQPHRTVFNLFVMEGTSHKEIAKELALTEGTSKWYLCEARKLLRSWISKSSVEATPVSPKLSSMHEK